MHDGIKRTQDNDNGTITSRYAGPDMTGVTYLMSDFSIAGWHDVALFYATLSSTPR